MSESTRSQKPAPDLTEISAARTTAGRLQAALNKYLAAETRHEERLAKKESEEARSRTTRRG